MRTELVKLNADLRKKLAVVTNDKDAVERVLNSLLCGQHVGQTPRPAGIVLFYRNKLRAYLVGELRRPPSL